MAAAKLLDDPFGRDADLKILSGAGTAARRGHDPAGHDAPEDDGEGFAILAPRVSRKEIIYVASQLAVMVDTGVTLSAALDGIIAQEANTTLRNLLSDVRDRVLGGESFSVALAKYPKHFDKTFLALIQAGEATGTLGQMLQRIATYLRKELETRSRVRAAMAYPTVMLVLASGVTVFLLTYVLPKFMPLFTRKGVTLPVPTVMMMSASEALTAYWYYWLAGCVALVAGFVFGKRTEPGRKVWDWVKISVPILGPMFRKVIISRSIRTLGTMLACGVSVLEALRLAAESAGNYHYQALWNHALDEVTGGNEINEALSGNPLIPATLVQMISAGEQTGQIDVVLERVSTYYDDEVETAIKTATSLIEPMMICVMGGVVGGIGMSLLLPIFSLSKPAG